jgi:two-component system invasion response regulator UvrY
MIRILIADDHAVVREGIKRILAETEDLIVTGEARTGSEVLANVAAHACDMVLLDISMPGRNGLDILRELKHVKPKLAVIVFSIHRADQYAVRAFKAGASGYVTKESIPDELVTAIRRVAHGGRYVSPSLAEELVLELTIAEKAPLHASLSNREFQVLCMFASGKSATEIADELSLSIKTVRTYRSHILEKLHLKTTTDLIRYAILHQLVD